MSNNGPRFQAKATPESLIDNAVVLDTTLPNGLNEKAGLTIETTCDSAFSVKLCQRSNLTRRRNPPMARALADVIQQSRGAAVLTDAARLLNELSKAVKESGKPGTLTLKLTIKPDKTDNTVVIVDPEVSVKTPKRPYPSSVFFVDDKTGDLTREDPRQLELLREKEEERAAQGVASLSQVGRGPA